MVRCAAVRSPGSGRGRLDILEDIAAFTGGHLVSEDRGRRLSDSSSADLGFARRIVVTKDNTLIAEGRSDPRFLEERIRRVKALIGSEGIGFERSKLIERLGRLSGRVVVLRAGGVTESDRVDNHYRLSSAIAAVQSAVKSGSVVGGGVSLLAGRTAIQALKPTSDGERAGLDAVSLALLQPLTALIRKVRMDDMQVEELVGVVTKSEGSIGVNVATGAVEDLVARGILDSIEIVLTALQQGFAHARGILVTDEWALETGKGRP